ncbi:hypothetical protein HYDPIDRAFT_23482 [Hydnomerulius pinastri MD-312]|nr:hypothetical protein HYDPIDRAFT_23482 [Hydnomerulius pinastri MD-312]
MSVSVEDLVASLSSNHIGQEAIDLAALQAQLAQTLFAHQLSSSLSSPHAHTSPFAHTPVVNVNMSCRDPTNVQHCTTPTARTPSSTAFAWPVPGTEQMEHVRKRSTSSARRQNADEGWCDLEEMDEERMVEDMITPDSPCSPNAYLWSSYQGNTHGSATKAPPTPTPTPAAISGMSSPIDSCSSSLFTSTDPFYLQASQSAQQSHSFFGHAGRPSAHSPFVMGHCQWDVPSWER